VQDVTNDGERRRERERQGKREREREKREREKKEREREEIKSRLSRGREEDRKRVTQAENGLCGQFLGAINDEPTERGHTRIFLRVGRRVSCIILNPDITGENFLSRESTFIFST